MKCLVTGASGFIGSNLVQALLARGHRVKALLRPGADERGLLGLKVDRVTGDLRDRQLLERELEGCDWCFHTAALHRFWVRHSAALFETNVEGTRTVLEAAGRAGCRKIIHTSTAACIGQVRTSTGATRPATEAETISPEQSSVAYVRSKFQAEAVAMELFRKKGLPIVIVNPSATAGPGDLKPSPTGQLIVDFLNRRLHASMATGLNWVHVHDVVAGHILAAEKGNLGERYLLASQDGNWTLRQTLTCLQEITGISAPRVHLPHWLAERCAEVFEYGAWVSGRSPRVPAAGLRLARHERWYDPAKAIRELGLPQTPPQQALADAVQWFRRNGYVKR